MIAGYRAELTKYEHDIRMGDFFTSKFTIS